MWGKQYLYHTEWRRSRDEEKHDRVLTLARRLPNLRAAVQSDLDGRGASKDRVLAAALRILDLGVFRTGGEEYAEENGTHGLAILLREHVTVRDSALVFCYPARGGIERNVRICDEDLLRAVKTMRRAAGATDRLLACRNDGTWHEVRSAEINERFKEFAGEEFTAKDLRTWNATVLAAMAPRTPHSRRASGAANARRPP
jgi:DNA topoisomerase IB